jgi:hypothetical protein
MLQLHVEAKQLCSTLAALEPVQLKGLVLLQSMSASQGFLQDHVEIPRETLRDAVLELMAYTDACTKTMQLLREITPVPLNTPLVEWVL